MEDKDSNYDILGFEDIDDDVSNRKHVEEVEETPASQTNSNVAKEKEPPGSNGSRQHAASGTRTKTASFSQNGYSDEILKVEQLLRAEGCKSVEGHDGASSRSRSASLSHNGYSEEVLKLSHKQISLGNTEAGKCSSHESQLSLPLGFEHIGTTRGITSHCLDAPKTLESDEPQLKEDEPRDTPSEESAPPGFEPHLQKSKQKRTTSGAVSKSKQLGTSVEAELNSQIQVSGTTHHPGYEKLNETRSIPRNLNVEGRPVEGSRRLIRSQVKRINESAEWNLRDIISTLQRDPSNSRRSKATRSSGTTESIARVAKESLELGNLIGLNITDGKEVAFKRLTSSLKKQRKEVINQEAK